MFSGIVEEMGAVKQVDHHPGILSLTIEGGQCMGDLTVGDSIAVNGVCLTVCQRSTHDFRVEVMPETLKLTQLGFLKVGVSVNLERSITPLTRIGGHFVQGHIDGTTTIRNIVSEGDALKVWFHKLIFYSDCFIPKGYIGIDGMSLTLVDVESDAFSICFIPHTQAVTIMQYYEVGTSVNVEVDHMTKTIVHVMNTRFLNERKRDGFH